MNVLICSQYGEIQVEEVSKKLLEKGINIVLFERYRRDQFIAYQYVNTKTSATLIYNDEEYSLDSKTFPVIWYRPKPIIRSEVPGELGKTEEKFCFQEWRTILLSLEDFLHESKWINPILNSQRASNKACQLKVAKEIGLIIPETIITNDSRKAVELYHDHRVIYKTLSNFYSISHAIYTNEVDKIDLVNHQEQIAMAPGIFQQYIEKLYELRITVVGEELFIARINSQQFEEASIDWRRRPDADLYEQGTISYSTKAKLLEFHHHFNLVYAAYDFVVDLQGNEIFLECNPSGQWLWLEDILGLEVSQLMADELIRSIKEQ